MPSPDIAAATSAIHQELAAVCRLYASLAPEMDLETGLGGKLLFAGELDAAGCRLVRAANIAGAASLAASAEAAIQRQAIHEGVIDFLVTSLDEALRILKNEIRKRQAVAVGVAAPVERVLREMLERGVLPDLLPPASLSGPAAPEIDRFLEQGARRVEALALPPGVDFLTLAIPTAWAGQPALFDALLLECLPEGDHANRRWLRLSPRYLGPQARRLRSLECDAATAARIAESSK